MAEMIDANRTTVATVRIHGGWSTPTGRELKHGDLMPEQTITDIDTSYIYTQGVIEIDGMKYQAYGGREDGIWECDGIRATLNVIIPEPTKPSQDLPEWASTYPKVVELCESDLGFRCAVINAETERYKNLLIRQAINRSR